MNRRRNTHSVRLVSLIAVLLLAAFRLPAQAQTGFTNGLLAYFPFNGNANDASGNGNNGVVTNGFFTFDRFGAANSGLRIPNGATMNAPLTNYIFTHTNAVTISLWVKFVGFSAQFANIAGLGGGQCEVDPENWTSG